MARGYRSEEKPDVTVKNVKIKRASEKAILIVTEGGQGEEIWLPKSQLRGASENAELKPGPAVVSVTMSAWIAGEKGLQNSEDNAGDDAGSDAEDDTGDYHAD